MLKYEWFLIVSPLFYLCRWVSNNDGLPYQHSLISWPSELIVGMISIHTSLKGIRITRPISGTPCSNVYFYDDLIWVVGWAPFFLLQLPLLRYKQLLWINKSPLETSIQELWIHVYMLHSYKDFDPKTIRDRVEGSSYCNAVENEESYPQRIADHPKRLQSGSALTYNCCEKEGPIVFRVCPRRCP